MAERHFSKKDVHVWDEEELRGIKECAEVLSLNPALLQKVVWHLQNIDDSMMEECHKPSDIQEIMICISAKGAWHVSSETPHGDGRRYG